MATEHKDQQDLPLPDASGMTFGIITAQWNHEITNALRDGCAETLRGAGVSADRIIFMEVPGAFELTSGARMMLEAKSPDSVICLGCVIKGETSHNEYINHAVANGLTQLGIEYNKPVISNRLQTGQEAALATRAAKPQKPQFGWSQQKEICHEAIDHRYRIFQAGWRGYVWRGSKGDVE
jgi:6,7-dimethyl-8-ribityllumazine synthase